MFVVGLVGSGININIPEKKVKSLCARRRKRHGHTPSTAGSCLLPVLLLPMCSILVCLSPSPQCNARLFWVCLCFSSPRASIQGQQHGHCSLLFRICQVQHHLFLPLSPGPRPSASLIPNMSSLYPSISLATRSVAPALYMLRTFQCPITRVSGHDSGVDWMLSFPQGFAHHHHTVIVGPHVTA